MTCLECDEDAISVMGTRQDYCTPCGRKRKDTTCLGCLARLQPSHAWCQACRAAGCIPRGSAAKAHAAVRKARTKKQRREQLRYYQDMGLPVPAELVEERVL